MGFHIRPFNGSDSDYEQICALGEAIYKQKVLPASVRREDENRSPQVKFARLVAEVDGRIVGEGEFSQHLGAYHPQRFEVSVCVHPDFRRRGLGSALYEELQALLRPHNPVQLNGGTREDWVEGLRFGAAKGFREVMRTWESHFHLQQADLSQYEELVEAVTAKGYSIRSATELEQQVPDFWPKLYELVMEVRQDIPSPVPMTPVPYDEWLKHRENPNRYPDAYMIALHGDEWVGLSSIIKTDEPGVLATGITAIKRGHRGTGITKALKVRVLSKAKADGHTKVKTWNESGNVKMLAINEWLGFERQPAWVSLQWNAEENQ